MPGPAQQRVFYPDNDYVREHWTDVYDEVRTEVLRRRSELERREKRENRLVVSLFMVVLALLAWFLLV